MPNQLDHPKALAHDVERKGEQKDEEQDDRKMVADPFQEMLPVPVDGGFPSGRQLIH
jgi:hypothetical protein